MNTILKNSCVLSLSLISGLFMAQEKQNAIRQKKIDSMKLRYITEAAVRTPILRQVVVSTEMTGKQNVEGELYGNPIYKGKMQHRKTSVLVTLPLKSWGKNSITGSFNFVNQEFNLSDVETTTPQLLPILNDLKVNRNSLGFNFGYQRIDSLFNRRAIYTANVNGLTSETNSIQRVGFLGTAMVQWISRKKTNLSAGVIVNINRSVNIPVLPLVMYWHQFNNGMELNVTLPQQAFVRKSFSPKFTMSLGSTLDTSTAFLEANNQNIIPNQFNFNVISLKNGALLEYRLTHNVMLGLNAGYQKSFRGRAFDIDESANNYFLKNTMGGSPYVMVSASLLPVISSIFK